MTYFYNKIYYYNEPEGFCLFWLQSTVYIK